MSAATATHTSIHLPADTVAPLLERFGWTHLGPGSVRPGAWLDPETTTPYWMADEALTIALTRAAREA